MSDLFVKVTPCISQSQFYFQSDLKTETALILKTIPIHAGLQ
jgi:hypothetical protein